MANMSQAIKLLVDEHLKALNLCDLKYGQVTQQTPLEIAISDRFKLHQSQLIIGASLAKTFYHVSRQTGQEYDVLVDNELKIGDKVILIRESGGRKYIVLDRYY